MNNLYLIRHLEDIDDLKYSLNSPLKKESKKDIKIIISNLMNFLVKEDKKNIIIFSSPKDRSIETSLLIYDQLKELNLFKKIRIIIDPNLRDLDQGKFILPNTYKENSNFFVLKKAWEIFSKETFEFKQDYRFGSPLSLDKKRYFKEIDEKFSCFGETSKEIYSRYCTFMSNLLKNKKALKNNIPIIVAHSITLCIIQELDSLNKNKCLCKDIKKEHPMYSCWNIYQRNRQFLEPKNFTDVKVIKLRSISNLFFLKLLNKGIKI